MTDTLEAFVSYQQAADRRFMEAEEARERRDEEREEKRRKEDQEFLLKLARYFKNSFNPFLYSCLLRQFQLDFLSIISYLSGVFC